MDTSRFHIYKSSAGSGKTTALIGIFLRISLKSANPAEFKSILAITFTNKAANELKERFIYSLKKIKSIDPKKSMEEMDFEVKKLLAETNLSPFELRERAERVFNLALRDYDEIGIGTIDGFNHKLIRSFSRDLRLKSDFEVELDEANLFADAVDQLLEKVGVDNHITHHLINYLKQSIDADRKVNIVTRLNDLRRLISAEDAETPVETLYEIEPQIFADTKRELEPVIANFVATSRSIGAKATEIFEEENISAEDLSYKRSGYFAFFDKLKNYSNEYITLHQGLLKKLDAPWHSASASAEAKQAIENRQTDLLQLYYQAESHFQKNYTSFAIAKALNAQIDLLAVLVDLSRELKSLAEERNVVPISTFNTLISNSMRDEPIAFIYEKFGNRYNHILIDEFQDTSELQWNNITPFVAESLAQGHFNMVVGDAKQSIYRWRGGKAEQLIQLPELSPDNARIPADTRRSFVQNAKIVPLGTNYRSLPNIVEFNNTLIAHLTPLLTEKDALFRAEYEGESARQSFPTSKEGGYIEWHQMDKNPEPDLVSSQVLKFVEDARKGGYSYGDLAVLVRKKGEDVNAIIRAFSEAGIPFTTRDSFGLDMNSTVGMLTAFLRLTLDENLAAAQVKAMREICRLNQKPFEPHKFWKKSNRHGSIDFTAFVKKISPRFSLHLLSGMSAWEVSRHIVNTLVPIESRRDVFVESFLNCILEKGGRSMSPMEFLEWWDNMTNKPEAKVGESGLQVRLMTIHKSKGLQFPVVILPNLNWKFTNRIETRWLRTNENLKIPFAYVPLPMSASLEKMGYKEELEQYDQENKFDNLNMIYVALTRPSERLYINHSEGTANSTGSALSTVFDTLKSELTNGVMDGNLDDGIVSTLALGEKKKAATTHQADAAIENIELENPVDIAVENRFSISSEGISPNREAGILFHELAAKSENFKEATDQLLTWKQNGRILPEQEEELTKWVEKLYSDDKYQQLIRTSKRFAERTLTKDGKIFRPDIVFVGPDFFTVIDFKTGDENEAHLIQVREYLDVIESTKRQSGEGYIVYLPEMKWVEVAKSTDRQGSLF